ncbi:hypothetical protein BOTBODRAFT_145941 [Botryobasidium botryosum FD-172 SS1]|uniref:Uncharacterized protein n=1 Tax=Botryobasidium botryosum (strain FD-172 SS1) TaxID=930990 RepID=A0A067MDB3_BOTB1|nr:hypothetical protein BOTBODRAFT_145941 [Botryobasidium botryosum FD-172 SS1]
MFSAPDQPSCLGVDMFASASTDVSAYFNMGFNLAPLNVGQLHQELNSFGGYPRELARASAKVQSLSQGPIPELYETATSLAVSSLSAHRAPAPAIGVVGFAPSTANVTTFPESTSQLSSTPTVASRGASCPSLTSTTSTTPEFDIASLFDEPPKVYTGPSYEALIADLLRESPELFRATSTVPSASAAPELNVALPVGMNVETASKTYSAPRAPRQWPPQPEVLVEKGVRTSETVSVAFPTLPANDVAQMPETENPALTPAQKVMVANIFTNLFAILDKCERTSVEVERRAKKLAGTAKQRAICASGSDFESDSLHSKCPPSEHFVVCRTLDTFASGSELPQRAGREPEA